MNKVISNKILKMVLLMTVLLWFNAGYAQLSTKDFLARYDLSYTVINPDTAPTDGVLRHQKKNGGVMTMNHWLTNG